MYAYIYIYIHTHVYISIYLFISLSLYLSLSLSIYISLSLYIYIYRYIHIVRFPIGLATPPTGPSRPSPRGLWVGSPAGLRVISATHNVTPLTIIHLFQSIIILMLYVYSVTFYQKPDFCRPLQWRLPMIASDDCPRRHPYV